MLSQLELQNSLVEVLQLRSADFKKDVRRPYNLALFPPEYLPLGCIHLLTGLEL